MKMSQVASLLISTYYSTRYTSILAFPAFRTRTKKGNDRSKYEMMPYKILLVFYFRFVDSHCRGTAAEKRFGFLC